MLPQITNEIGYFKTVLHDSEHFQFVSDQFQNIIAPLYGDQTDALRKIAARTDRTCEVLLRKISDVPNSPNSSDASEQIVGILVYKSEPVQEFSSYGVQDALELKTLFVVNAGTQSGRGLGTTLVNRIIEVAQDVKFKAIVVTVSDEKQESQAFFKKKGFVEIASFNGKYKEGVNEYIYAYRMPLK